MVKAVAASRCISISSHGELFSYVRRLGEGRGPGTQEALLRGWHVAPEFPRELVEWRCG